MVSAVRKIIRCSMRLSSGQPSLFFLVNIAAQKSVTNENPVLERQKDAWSMVKMLRSCRKGLPGVQQGPCRITTGLPSHDDGGPVATQGGPYCRTNHDILAEKNGFSAL